jgi:hypothetical protein
MTFPSAGTSGTDAALSRMPTGQACGTAAPPTAVSAETEEMN